MPSLFSYDERISVLSAIRRSADWLVSRMGESGCLRLEEGAIAKDPQCYYKVIWALGSAGRLREANLISSYAKSKFMLENGDFSGGDPRSETEWFQWRYYTYLNVWFVIGAHKLGRFDLSFPGIQYMMRYRDPLTGGFCNERPYPEGRYIEDALAASYNGLACLYLGKIVEARGAGDFLMELLRLQPVIEERFYTAFNGKEGLITDYPQEEALYRLVDAQEMDQYHFYIGYPIIFLSKLFLVTDAETYLETAKAYFDFTKLCQDDVYASPPSGKLGWGSAALYGITGDEDMGSAVGSQVRYLLETQDEEGCWSRFPGFKHYLNGEEYPISGKIDLTSEFCAWLSEIMKEG